MHLKHKFYPPKFNPLDLITNFPPSRQERLKSLTKITTSQLCQELLVLGLLNFKQGGFFVEFGAANGVNMSNSYLLEKQFRWRGILAEPSKHWHEELKTHRTAFVDTGCVWHSSGKKVVFHQNKNPYLSTTLPSDSTISSYQVNTISLKDLLKKYNAPKDIDFLSIDTEGTEFDILSHFDFSKHTFKVISCEHNYESRKKDIQLLLQANNYTQVFSNLSQYDAWFIHNSLKP